MPKYYDLGDEEEDARIEKIGNAAKGGGKIAFVTDDDPGKAERYIAKLKERFPGIVVLERHPGPVPKCVTVIVQMASA